MKALKSARIVAASLGVLAFGAMAASPAMAFDNVDWSWRTHVNEWVNIDACIKLNIVITGMVQVEKLQIFLGDSKATSNVSHIYNTPFYPVVEQPKKDDHYPKPTIYGKNEGGDKYDSKPVQTYAVDDTHYYYRDAKSSYWDYEHELKLHDRGGDPDFDKVNVKPLDARTELPIILASTTALGNNQSITSDVPVFLHDGQFVANVSDREKEHCKGPWCDSGAMLSTVGTGGSFGDTKYNQGPSGNLNTTVALLFGIGAVTHNLTKAEISAKSEVYDVHNVSVDASATALANNISVNVASTNPSNHLVIADITQFALANVTASSSVKDVTATGYDHMRELTTDTLQTVNGVANTPVAVPTPWINASATAIGNNASITVGPVLTNYQAPKPVH